MTQPADTYGLLYVLNFKELIRIKAKWYVYVYIYMRKCIRSLLIQYVWQVVIIQINIGLVSLEPIGTLYSDI